MKKVFIFSFIFFSIFVLTACDKVKKENIEIKTDDIQLVGNDVDEHGCKASAGYSWCEEKNKCLRVWEESCQDSINELIKDINKNVKLNLTYLGKNKFNWLEENENKELLGSRFFDFKISSEKLDILINYIKENTELNLKDTGLLESDLSSTLSFRHNLDVCQMTYSFNNDYKDEITNTETINKEREIEIICSMYK